LKYQRKNDDEKAKKRNASIKKGRREEYETLGKG
jgi:hypothetical protein